jgi:predicted nucleic acid-binding protein
VILGELFSGIKPGDLANVEQFVTFLTWYPATSTIARRAGRWRYDWARQGVALSITDTLIAATAVEHGLTLLTENRKHFPMPEISLHTWD